MGETWNASVRFMFSVLLPLYYTINSMEAKQLV